MKLTSDFEKNIEKRKNDMLKEENKMLKKLTEKLKTSNQ